MPLHVGVSSSNCYGAPQNFSLKNFVWLVRQADKASDSFCRNRSGGKALSQFVFSDCAIHFSRQWNQLAKFAIRLENHRAKLLVLREEQSDCWEFSELLSRLLLILERFDMAL